MISKNANLTITRFLRLNICELLFVTYEIMHFKNRKHIPTKNELLMRYLY